MSNHTPGPWIVKHFDKDGDILIDAPAKRGSGLLCRVFPPNTVLDIGTKDEKWLCTEQDVDECEANARLISAAPDLLEALKKTLDMCLALNAEQPAYYDNVAVKRACTIADARAAIAKATGNV